MTKTTATAEKPKAAAEKKAKAVRIKEEDQGAINPLAGVLKYETPNKKWYLDKDRLSYTAFCQSEEGVDLCGWDVTVNKTHHVGQLFFDPETDNFFSFGLRQTRLDGADSADRIDQAKTREGAVKLMLKRKWTKEYNQQMAG